ncbi:MAG: HAD-IA family hydrolase [Actinomycetes bacterium]
MPGPRALIVDWYGVLTVGIDDAMSAWCEDDGIEYPEFRVAMAEWFGDAGYAEATFNPVHALERGELEVPDFEEQLVERLRRSDGTALPAEGLLVRMFARFEHRADMAGLVLRARAAGRATALLSNSWGDQYLRSGWDEMFDVVVISGEVGMRKPESRIFLHTAERLGLDPHECVFVDDTLTNVRAAAELGLIGVHHRSYAETAAELEAIFGVRLAE